MVRSRLLSSSLCHTRPRQALLRAIGKLTERLKGSSPAARDGRPAAARSPTKKVKKTAADRAKAKRGRKSK